MSSRYTRVQAVCGGARRAACTTRQCPQVFPLKNHAAAAPACCCLQDYEQLPSCFETSAQLGQGRVEVLQYLASLRQLEAAEGGDFL
jgi:hypothetical protein